MQCHLIKTPSADVLDFMQAQVHRRLHNDPVDSEQQAVIQARLNAINMTEDQLAMQLGITPTMLRDLLSRIDLDDDLVMLLDALDLEIVIRPKIQQ